LDKTSEFTLRSRIIWFYKSETIKIMSPMDPSLSKTPSLTLFAPHLAKYWVKYCHFKFFPDSVINNPTIQLKPRMCVSNSVTTRKSNLHSWSMVEFTRQINLPLSPNSEYYCHVAPYDHVRCRKWRANGFPHLSSMSVGICGSYDLGLFPKSQSRPFLLFCSSC